ncbi:hypothetical protein PHYSODRAFT_306561 [Phytophthora sojae]|uniref:Uncharacterized protein n=1 Tax=Phytophthora sojae (strain P6497) TaxID=1094619 RepID=G5A9T8_PHYSP|nr:hypothetical protein PHYSODRAFT_306561 [Phytophthora sojae]EGZ07368.1 hypothetical protein PHYSODRAFT_306561 [Phytophthora sojae]|eukprot:XP_009536934.1 hypothetical protein PHYSODRAFT_306561 [Phytophthora sojae]
MPISHFSIVLTANNSTSNTDLMKDLQLHASSSSAFCSSPQLKRVGWSSTRVQTTSTGFQGDQCYSFARKKLNDAVTSAKWGGLTEKMVDGGDAMIAFYTDRDCLERNVWWRSKTQSDDNLYFPSNFRLDGINDEVSSFMVWHKSTKKVGNGRRDICATESGEIVAATINNSASGSGSGAFDNGTIAALA